MIRKKIKELLDNLQDKNLSIVFKETMEVWDVSHITDLYSLEKEPIKKNIHAGKEAKNREIDIHLLGFSAV